MQKVREAMEFYYPIPAGAAVICRGCGALLRTHLDERGGWRGCPIANDGDGNGHGEGVATFPVWLVSAGRRRGRDRRVGDERRRNPQRGGDAEAPIEVTVATPVPARAATPAALPPPIVAGPRAAVYLAKAGVLPRNLTGQAQQVFTTLTHAGPAGRTAKELQKALKISPKSLESVLYRLRLRDAIIAVRAEDVRP